MTPEQQSEFYAKLRTLLGEHATSFLCIVEVPDGDDASITLMSWDGGFNTALGLANRARLRMEMDARKADDPESDGPGDESEEWKKA